MWLRVSGFPVAISLLCATRPAAAGEVLAMRAAPLPLPRQNAIIPGHSANDQTLPRAQIAHACARNFHCVSGRRADLAHLSELR